MKIFKKLLVSLGAFIGVATFGAVASADTVTVQSGDTLSGIATNHNTTIDELAKLNNLANIDMIYVGQQLELPESVRGAYKQTQAPVQTSAQQPAMQNNTQNTNINTNTNTQPAVVNTNNSGSVHDEFITNGGTEEMWNAIVVPESGGNPNASNGRYHGLGQTDQSFGYGSVANQTQGMVNYAVSRYGSVNNAIAFRQANGWW